MHAIFTVWPTLVIGTFAYALTLVLRLISRLFDVTLETERRKDVVFTVLSSGSDLLVLSSTFSITTILLHSLGQLRIFSPAAILLLAAHCTLSILIAVIIPLINISLDNPLAISVLRHNATNSAGHVLTYLSYNVLLPWRSFISKAYLLRVVFGYCSGMYLVYLWFLIYIHYVS